MDNEYYKRYEPFFGAWYIKRYIGAGSYWAITRTAPRCVWKR